MKTPKPAQEKQKNLAAPAGGKITKNKGKNQPGNKLDAAKAKLGLQKAKETVKVQKNVQKKSEMKNKVFNGKGSPKAVNGSAGPNAKGGKKRKSDESLKPEVVVNEKKSKKTQGAAKSPEVQLGLKIEKLLESPKSDGPGKKNRKRGKKGAASAQEATPKAPSQAGASPAQGKKKRKGKGKKAAGGSPVGVTPTEKQQKKGKPQAAPKPKTDWDKPIPLGNFPTRTNAENAVKALLKHLKEHKSKKPALLDEYEPLMLCVDFFKHPQSRNISRVVLPHQILGDNPDIVFVVTDAKKAKRDFDESIEKHKELFRSRGVTNISEFIPWRKLCYEYTQFEEKRKLANRADTFLIDSKLSHRWPAIMRKKFFRKKAPIPVRIDGTTDLKKNVEIALKKIAIIFGRNSLSASPQFGHTKMNVKSLVDNLITIVTVLCDEAKFPSGQANIRQINIRSAKSEAFPVFVSTASPNSVETPKKTKKKRGVVEGELTTAGVTVAVHPGGRVQVKSKDKDDEEEGNTSPQKKKVKGEVDSDDDVEDEDESIDDDDDSEIDASLLEKFKRANKASDDESSDEEEIEKAEQEFLLALRKQQDALENEALAKSKKAGKKAPVVKAESSDDDEDDDLDDEEDDSDVPDLIPAKKSKPQAQQPKKGKNAKQSPVRGKPGQNGLGKGKPGKGQPGKQAQSPKAGPGKKGPKGGKGNANQKGNNKGSPKAQQRYFNKGGKKK